MNRSGSREPDANLIAQLKTEILRELGQQNHLQRGEFLKLQQIVLDREERIKELESKIGQVELRVIQMNSFRETLREQTTYQDSMKIMIKQMEEQIKQMRFSGVKEANEIMGKLEGKVKITVDDIVQKFSHMEETFLELFRHKEKIFERIHLGYQNLLSSQENIEGNLKRIYSIVDRKADQQTVRAFLSEFKQEYQSKIEDLSSSGLMNTHWKLAQTSQSNQGDTTSQIQSQLIEGVDPNLHRITQKLGLELTQLRGQKELLQEFHERIRQLEEERIRPKAAPFSAVGDQVRYLSSPSADDMVQNYKKNDPSSAGIYLQNFITDAKSSQGKSEVFQTEKASQNRQSGNQSNNQSSQVSRNLIFEAYEQAFSPDQPKQSKDYIKGEGWNFPKNTDNSEQLSPYPKTSTNNNILLELKNPPEPMQINEAEQNQNSIWKTQTRVEDVERLKIKTSVAGGRNIASKTINRVRSFLDNLDSDSKLNQIDEFDKVHEQQLQLLSRPKGTENTKNMFAPNRISEKIEAKSNQEDDSINLKNIFDNTRKTKGGARSSSSHYQQQPQMEQFVEDNPITHQQWMKPSEERLNLSQKKKESTSSQNVQYENPLDRRSSRSRDKLNSMSHQPLSQNKLNPLQPKQDLPPLNVKSQKELSKSKQNLGMDKLKGKDQGFGQRQQQNHNTRGRIEHQGYYRGGGYEEEYMQEEDDDVVYQIDADGYLMDEQGEYLRDEQGNFIRLTQDQLDNLRDQNLVVEEDAY